MLIKTFKFPFLISICLNMTIYTQVFAEGILNNYQDDISSVSSNSRSHSSLNLSFSTDSNKASEKIQTSELLDWKTFDSSKKVCLAKHSYGQIKDFKKRTVLSYGIGTGALVGYSTIFIPIATSAAFFSSFFAPWVGVPALAVSSYYAHKHSVQNSRQKHLMQLMFTPEKELELLFELQSYAQNRSGSKSIGHNYEMLFSESMKTNSNTCNSNGSLKSFKDSLTILSNVETQITFENMSMQESDVYNQVSKYSKLDTLRNELKSAINSKRRAKKDHLFSPLNYEKKADYLEKKKSLKSHIQNINEQAQNDSDLMLSLPQGANAKIVSKNMKKTMKKLKKNALESIAVWVKDEGKDIANKHIDEYNTVIATYPKLTMEQKYQRWNLKRKVKKDNKKAAKEYKKSMENKSKESAKEKCKKLEQDIKEI